jgi:hypothetical protein
MKRAGCRQDQSRDIVQPTYQKPVTIQQLANIFRLAIFVTE